MELVLPVPPPCTMPSALESWLEPLRGFGDQKSTDATGTTCVWTLGGSHSCPSSTEYLWVSMDLAASADVGQEGLLELCRVQGTGGDLSPVP